MDPKISLQLHQTSSDFRNYTTWKEANGPGGFALWWKRRTWRTVWGKDLSFLVPEFEGFFPLE